MDPLAEKYYSLSPYAYCAGDPVNLVDPKGTHNYKFTSNGNWIKQETDDPFDLLIAESGEQMYVFNQDIMGNMHEGKFYHYISDDLPDEIRNLHYSVFDSKDPEVLNVFKFLADNTAVEWLLFIGANDESLLGTNHLSDRIKESTIYSCVKPSSSVMDQDPIWKIHNHPGMIPNEIDSMSMDIYNSRGHPSIQSFVYFNQSGNIYLIQNVGIKKNVKWTDLIKLYPGH